MYPLPKIKKTPFTFLTPIDEYLRMKQPDSRNQTPGSYAVAKFREEEEKKEKRKPITVYVRKTTSNQSLSMYAKRDKQSIAVYVQIPYVHRP